MNPSYFRIKLPSKEAVERLYHWNGKMPKEVLQTTYDHAVEQAFFRQFQPHHGKDLLTIMI